MAKRARRWVFTINNYDAEDVKPLEDLRCRYIVYGREAGEQGTVHLQGYVVFKNPTTFERVKKYMPRAHIEIAKKNHAANIKYCKKDGVFWERGSLPNVGSVEDVEIPEGVKMKDLSAHLNGLRLVRGIKLERQMFQEIRANDLHKPYILYIHGNSGTGKTYTGYCRALDIYENEEVATLDFKNGFAISNNYHAKCLILPEFRPSTVDAATFLQLTDGYGMVLNVKGSHVYIRPEMVIICSIKTPDEIYKDEINVQFKRRISEIINKNDDPFIEYTETCTDASEEF